MFLRGLLVVGILVILMMGLTAAFGGAVATFMLAPAHSSVGGLWFTLLCGLGLLATLGLPLLLLVGGGLLGRHRAWKMVGQSGDQGRHPFHAARAHWHRHWRPGAAPPWWCRDHEETVEEPKEPDREEPR
jgi:hypothetical protein